MKKIALVLALAATPAAAQSMKVEDLCVRSKTCVSKWRNIF
jgi:hypothetical protein